MAKRAIRPIRIEGNIAYVPLTKGYEAMIDADDVHLVDAWNWVCAVQRRNNGDIRSIYAYRGEYIGGRQNRSVFLHRVILGLGTVMRIDHIDGDGLNNRRANLREATAAQNQRNTRISPANKSGVKGVHWHKASAKWRAQITVNGTLQYLGTFSELEAAAAAYAKASAALHGEFGRIA